jgi:hypothetical protein
MPGPSTGRMAFVPEGQADRSLARSGWNSATPREPSRRVRCDSCRCGHDTMIGVILLKKCSAQFYKKYFRDELRPMIIPYPTGRFFRSFEGSKSTRLKTVSCNDGVCDRGAGVSRRDNLKFRGTLSRHFVPGYDRVVPPGRASRRFATTSN